MTEHPRSADVAPSVILGGTGPVGHGTWSPEHRSFPAAGLSGVPGRPHVPGRTGVPEVPGRPGVPGPQRLALPPVPSETPWPLSPRPSDRTDVWPTGDQAAERPDAPARGLRRGRSALDLPAALRLVREVVRGDAALEGLPRWWAWSLFWTPLVGSVVLGVLLVADRSAFVWLLKDDHPVEWVQFGVMLFTTLLSATVALSAVRRRTWDVAVVAGLVALASLFVSGEEVSWGQRVFSLVTPAHLVAMNGQNELNVHDIRVGLPIEAVINFAEMVFALAVAVLPWLTRGSLRRLPSRLTSLLPWHLLRLVSPPVYTTPAFALMFAYRFVRFFVLPREYDAVVSFKQWMEMGFYLGLMTLAISLSVQLRRQRPPRHRRTQVLADGGEALGIANFGLLAGYAAVAAVVTVVFTLMTMASGLMPG